MFLKLSFVLVLLLISSIQTFNFSNPEKVKRENVFNKLGVSRIIKDNGQFVKDFIKLVQNFVLNLSLSQTLLAVMTSILAKVFIGPFQFVFRTLSKYLLFVSVTLYVLFGLSESWIQSVGPSVNSFLPRFVTSSFTQMYKKVDDVFKDQNLYFYLDNGLRLLQLNQEDCVNSVSCKLGLRMAQNYPWMASYLTKIAGSMPPQVLGSVNNKTKVILESMANFEESECVNFVTQCPTLQIIETYWFEMDKQTAAKSIIKALQNLIRNNKTDLNMH